MQPLSRAELREAYGVRGIPALWIAGLYDNLSSQSAGLLQRKAAEYAALQTLRDLGCASPVSTPRISRSLLTNCCELTFNPRRRFPLLVFIGIH